jgi:hypothetical protein
VDPEGTIGARLHRGSEDPGELRAIVADVDGRLGETTGRDEADVERVVDV